jgi:glycosyl-4,4'-diaponeurosporenoate acyltransferase
MPIELPFWWILILNCIGWPTIQMGLAWLFTQMPAKWFDTSSNLMEEEWIHCRVFHVHRWKDRLPDAAGWFTGGFSKRSLAAAEPDYLRRFIRETRRGELCHWGALAFVPIFFLWNPWWADLVCLSYAVAANLPCIIVQRYNRLRLQKLLARKSSHSSQVRE